MKQRDLAKSTISLGAAAILGVTATACSHPKALPTDTSPPATAPATTAPATTAPAPDASAPAATALGATAPDASAPAATAPTPTPPATATQPGKPDCTGADRFTEACGYASPTRYAVLDPASIVNA